MKPKRAQTSKTIVPAVRSFDGLVCELRAFITESRRQIVRAVDVAQVRTCWGVGRYIVEFEQGGSVKAEYGAKLLPRLAGALTADFGRGFDASNLRYMRQFYLAFPICDTLCHKLSWSHYRKLIRVEDSKAREWYINEAVTQNWGVRALDRQINRLYYERLLSSRDKKAVRAEAEERVAELPPSPRDFVRDPVLLEFLGLPETGRLLETDLEQGLINHLQSFLLELGKGFAFIGRQVRVGIETKFDGMCHCSLRRSLVVVLLIFACGLVNTKAAGDWPGYPEDHFESGVLFRVTPTSESQKLFASLRASDAKHEVLGDYRGISRVRLVAGDRRRVLQELPGISGCYADDAQIGDFNFDGYKDFRFYSRIESGKGWGIYHHFVFNPRSQRFEACEELDKLPWPHFDHETKQALAMSKAGGGIHCFTWYRWSGRRLQMIRRVNSDRNEHGRMFTDITVRLSSGKLSRTRHYVDEEG